MKHFKLLVTSVMVITGGFLLNTLVSPVEAVELPPQALSHMPVCNVGNPNIVHCHALVVTNQNGKPMASTSPYGYGPAQLLAAYQLNPTVASARTIAVVDAYDHPNILSDLNTYSTAMGIPTMNDCAVSTGTASAPCFQKVDQRGGTSYPAVDSGWALETSMDVEVAHALCQNCNILLVVADSSSYYDLMAAVDRAVSMGAKVVSNSYGSNEFSSETSFDYHFNVPGVAFTFSSGDGGYGTSYPAASRYVTAVGGTTLNMSGNTYVSETVWNGSGSGCSNYESKPSWQKDKNCSRRTIADVAAVADPYTGASVYNSVPYYGQTGWYQVGGTSLSAPVVAAVYALGGDVNTLAPANSLPYARVNYGVNMRDVTKGNNGRCNKKAGYLCTGVNGYDGPTGLGTPLGIAAF